MPKLWFSYIVAFVLVIPEPATFALAVITVGWFAVSALQATATQVVEESEMPNLVTSDEQLVSHIAA